MNMDTKTYKKYVKARAPKSPCIKNCMWAFFVGGTVCALGQVLISLYKTYLFSDEKDAGTLASVTLVFIAVVMTGIGVFDVVAKRAGGGTLLPITGKIMREI